MPRCPECGTESDAVMRVCPACGTEFDGAGSESDESVGAGEVAGMIDGQEESPLKRQIEARYGIDIGDQSPREYIDDLRQRDYSRTVWFWAIVACLVAWGTVGGIGAFVETYPWIYAVMAAVSAVLPIAVFADTRAVGEFSRWSKTRWTYVLFAVVPLAGEIAGVLYLLERHLAHEEAIDELRRLNEAAIDLDLDLEIDSDEIGTL